MKKLILCRGISGSGKSFLANELVNKYRKQKFCCTKYSTDDFFMIAGEYKFDPSKLGEYHEKNLMRVINAMRDELDLIVVDNTNTTFWECKKYILAAFIFDYEIELKEPSTVWSKNVEECTNRNSHNCPREAIERQLKRYENNIDIMIQVELIRSLV